MQIGNAEYAVLFIILVVTVGVMQWAGGSLKETPPPTRISRTSPGRAIVLLGLLLLLTASLFTARDVQAYRKLNAIQQHGQRTEATVDLFNWSFGRGPGSRSVRYHYAVWSAGRDKMTQYEGEEYLGPLRPNDPHFVYANTKGRVPIAFDLSNPQNSALNFEDSVFTGAQAQGRIINAESGLRAALCGFVFFTLALIVGSKLDLLGAAAEAGRRFNGI